MNAIAYQFGLTKTRRKRLIFPLIIAEILGILVLVWLLRAPLYQKYLAIEPVNYSINSLESDKQYLFKQGDFITGKAQPNQTLQIWLAPDGLKHALTTDAQGNFSFQIPPETIPDSYQLVIAGDDSGKINLIETLKIRIESNSKFKF